MTTHTRTHTKNKCLLFANPSGTLTALASSFVPSKHAGARVFCVAATKWALTRLLCSCFSAAHNVTLEEILSSYKQACQKLNCKPIAKVVKQIQVRPPVLPPQRPTHLLPTFKCVWILFLFFPPHQKDTPRWRNKAGSKNVNERICTL